MKPANTAHARAYWSEASVATLPPPVDARRQRAGWPTIELCGVHLHAVTQRQCIERIVNCAATGEGGWVVTPNLHILRRCWHDASLAALVQSADLVVADGMPLLWASRLQKTPLPARVAGSSIIAPLSAAAAERGLRVFLLGGDPGTAEAAAAVLQRRSPMLDVAGTHCPPVGFERDERELARIESRLAETQPHIVFVALGFPKQERLIRRLRPILPQAWWLGVGISFSFLAGAVQRAPVWVQRVGLEWAHRLCQEPRRLGRRYLVEGVPFAAGLLVKSAWRGIRATKGR